MISKIFFSILCILVIGMVLFFLGKYLTSCLRFLIHIIMHGKEISKSKNKAKAMGIAGGMLFILPAGFIVAYIEKILNEKNMSLGGFYIFLCLGLCVGFGYFLIYIFSIIAEEDKKGSDDKNRG